MRSIYLKFCCIDENMRIQSKIKIHSFVLVYILKIIIWIIFSICIYMFLCKRYFFIVQRDFSCNHINISPKLIFFIFNFMWDIRCMVWIVLWLQIISYLQFKMSKIFIFSKIISILSLSVVFSFMFLFWFIETLYCIIFF